MAYTEIRELGRGSFGVVHLVEDDDGNQWAKKTFSVPNLQGGNLQDIRRRFEREVRYQSKLDHPNVVKIFDFNLGDDPPWYIMEVAVGSLRDELEVDRTLGGDPRKALFDVLARIIHAVA